MSHRKLKKWPGKKAHRGDGVRSEGNWSGKVDTLPEWGESAIREIEEDTEE